MTLETYLTGFRPPSDSARSFLIILQIRTTSVNYSLHSFFSAPPALSLTLYLTLSLSLYLSPSVSPAGINPLRAALEIYFHRPTDVTSRL